MSDLAPIRSGWSRGRFWLVAAVLFAGQVGWVLLMGERPRLARETAAPRPLFRLLDTPLDDEKWTKDVFAGNPMVFPSLSPHGFADQAWRRLRANDYAAPVPEPGPAFLEFAAKWSGAGVPPAGLEPGQIPFQLAGQPGLSRESIPAFPAAEASRPESFLQIEGPLSGRRVSPPAMLPSWTTNYLVTNSVVQFAVNRAGLVISEVLLDGSGLKEADDAALATVNRLRFRPAGGSAADYALDQAVFYWKTIPPPAK